MCTVPSPRLAPAAVPHSADLARGPSVRRCARAEYRPLEDPALAAERTERPLVGTVGPRKRRRRASRLLRGPALRRDSERIPAAPPLLCPRHPRNSRSPWGGVIVSRSRRRSGGARGEKRCFRGASALGLGHPAGSPADALCLSRPPRTGIGRPGQRLAQKSGVRSVTDKPWRGGG